MPVYYVIYILTIIYYLKLKGQGIEEDYYSVFNVFIGLTLQFISHEVAFPPANLNYSTIISEKIENVETDFSDFFFTFNSFTRDYR